MKFLTKEEEREHPELAFRSYQCQARYIRMKSKCRGCNCMVPGCEKVVKKTSRRKVLETPYGDLERR